MPVREFLRGGYQRITEPTVVSNHGHPMFTVMPGIRKIPQRDPIVVDLETKRASRE